MGRIFCDPDCCGFSVMVFIVSRQPYAGIICFALLTIKAFLVSQGK